MVNVLPQPESLKRWTLELVLNSRWLRKEDDEEMPPSVTRDEELSSISENAKEV